MSTVSAPPDQKFLLGCISWPQYVWYSDMLGERHVRVTYDRGRMEFMTVSPEHERAKKLLARLVEAFTVEADIAIASFGSMTFRREVLDRGLEPDECYWIKNEPRVRGRTDIDPDDDPPPDLILEVEISRSALDRIGLYSALRVPEVWRYDGESLRACWLQPDGTYEESDRSLAFPSLPLAELERFLNQRASLDETTLIRQFIKWVRQQIARKGKPTSSKKGKRKRS